MGARHRQTRRQVSWFNDDSCDGMLPVKLLFLKVLQTGAGHRRMPEVSERSTTALAVLHCTAPGAHARPQRVLHGAPPRLPRVCYQTAAPRLHGRTYRSLSLISDDICDGMMPVRRLLRKLLHTSGGRRARHTTTRRRGATQRLSGILRSAMMGHTAAKRIPREPARLVHAY